MKQFKYDKVGTWYRVTETFTMETGIVASRSITSKFSHLNSSGRITIYKGFCWDGATGAIDTDDIMRASCIHDAFCYWYKKKLISKENRKQADKLFKTILKEDMKFKFRIKYLYQAVRKFFEIKH